MKDLAKQVAELLSPGPWKHNWINVGGIEHCKICREMWNKEKETTECIAPPIDITDLGKALECFRETCADVRNKTMDEYVKDMMHKNWRMENFYADRQVILNLHWILLKATPEQLFEICVLAKEGEVT